MKSNVQNGLHTIVKKAVQNMIFRESNKAAPSCFGVFYQPKRPNTKKEVSTK